MRQHLSRYLNKIGIYEEIAFLAEGRANSEFMQMKLERLSEPNRVGPC